MRSGLALVVALLVLAGCLKVDVPDAPAPGSGPRQQGADFTWSPAEPHVGETITFTALLDAQPLGLGQRVAWAVDGKASTEAGAQLRHSFPTRGGHQVTMTIAGHPTVSHVVTVLPKATSLGEPGDGGLPVLTDPTIDVEAHDIGHSFGWSWSIGAKEVAWDFGDGNVSLQSEPTHLYAEPGTYQVLLTIGNGSFVGQASTLVEVTKGAPKFFLSPVAPDAGEPTVGVTSSGCIFFQADQDVMRSCDEGATWTLVEGLLSSPDSSDPFLLVDPITDRIFSAHLEPNGECIWMAWSDDDGESWLGNPADCGPIPLADHQKVTTGPRIGPLASVPSPLYEQAVYLCVNKISVVLGVGFGIHCYVSFDGGATFPHMSAVQTGSGLHGAIKVGPDGSLYVPARTSPIVVHASRDGAVSWEPREVGAGVGVQDPTKDPDVAIDETDHVFATWVAADDSLRVARSPDGGRTWESPWLAAPDLGAVAFPIVQAFGGKLALAFLGTNDYHGNPEQAPPEARWDLYVAWSTDAWSERPKFLLQQVTPDPVQVGPICMEGNCADGSRNLLDFIGSTIDGDGRFLVAFADGCIDACTSAPTVANSRSAFGVLAVALDGPSLR